MTLTTYKTKRGRYKLCVFTVKYGLETFKITGKKELRKKIKAIEKLYACLESSPQKNPPRDPCPLCQRHNENSSTNGLVNRVPRELKPMTTDLPKGFKPFKILYFGKIFKSFKTEKGRDDYWKKHDKIYEPNHTKAYQITADDMED